MNEYQYTNPFTQAVVVTLRKLRADYSLTRQRPACFVVCADAARASALASLASEAATLATSSGVEVFGPGARGAPPAGCSVAIVDDVTTVHMLLKGILDPALELAKLDKKRGEAAARAEALRGKMAMPAYQGKTPPAVKAEDEVKLSKLEAEAAAAEQAMADMRQLLESEQQQ
ncbi:valine-tRNA ligase [Raphidocelis subcapitata]|uniref:valine--tRNA ligase n=1 Tax=Raphidocelis subcapitata TaxID=307507 RepID=A0A2V0NUD2_9CHLO|nr:valine-tRNA ligase [Raphidocelis subcapitata]|eukprot:GBF88537.1 valine-tRNA ligase [Raphidocelis subcapitata]